MLTEFERDILESVKDGKAVYEEGILNACLLLQRKRLVLVGVTAMDEAGRTFNPVAITHKGLMELTKVD